MVKAGGRAASSRRRSTIDRHPADAATRSSRHRRPSASRPAIGRVTQVMVVLAGDLPAAYPATSPSVRATRRASPSVAAAAPAPASGPMSSAPGSQMRGAAAGKAQARRERRTTRPSSARLQRRGYRVMRSGRHVYQHQLAGLGRRDGQVSLAGDRRAIARADRDAVHRRPIRWPAPDRRRGPAPASASPSRRRSACRPAARHRRSAAVRHCRHPARGRSPAP